MEPVVFRVFAVVPLGSREPEGPLLQKGILPVPERERKAQALIFVADAERPSSFQR
jgi:hypothetical protein